MRSSLFPSWYSQALSMKVMPASTASCTMRIASFWVAGVAEVVAAEPERGDGDAGAAEGTGGDGFGHGEPPCPAYGRRSDPARPLTIF